MSDDTRNRTDDRNRVDGYGNRLPGRSGGVSLQGITSRVPSTRQGQRAFSDYARAIARETLRESAAVIASQRAADAERITEPPGGRVPLFDADEDEPDTGLSRVLAPLNTAKLVEEFRASLREEEPTEPTPAPSFDSNEPSEPAPPSEGGVP